MIWSWSGLCVDLRSGDVNVYVLPALPDEEAYGVGETHPIVRLFLVVIPDSIITPRLSNTDLNALGVNIQI